MNDFEYRENQLWCEGIPVAHIAREAGTPVYIYSYRTLERHFHVFDEAFSGIPHLVCFSVKANSNLAILRIFINEGSGVDIVSGGELFRALQAGADPKKIVYSGVGKKTEEIDFALASNILMFNVESTEELTAINACARRLRKKARIALRINPDVDALTHPHISTGLKENKFGINIERSVDEYRRARELRNIEIIGVDCHIGSQITAISPFVDALERIARLVKVLRGEGFRIKYLDLGGGLGITYNKETPPHPRDYADALKGIAKDLACTVILEPGRVIVGNAGIMVARVLYRKSNAGKNFIIVDAGMNDLIRPSLYGSFHRIQPVLKQNRRMIEADVVGPICESGDFLAKKRSIPEFDRGELLAVMSAGAYGFTMSSNYNSRPRVAEVLVKGGKSFVIRRREGYSDLTRGERIPGFLRVGGKQ